MLHIQAGSATWTVPPEELEQRADRGRIPVRELVDANSPATHATFESSDGTYRASIPLDVARDRGVVLLEGVDLRLMVEDGETLCWNVKDLGRIRLTVGKEPDSVPADPPH